MRKLTPKEVEEIILKLLEENDCKYDVEIKLKIKEKQNDSK